MKAAGRAAPRRVALKGAASRHRLYAELDEDGQLSNRNEGYLALIEDHAAPALKCLLEDPDSLSPGQRATIAFFIAVQTRRTPDAAAQVTAVAETVFQNVASEMFSDRAAFAERHREFFGRDADEAEIEAYRKVMIGSVREGKVRLVGERGAAFAEGLRHAVELVPPIIAFDWTLLRAPGGLRERQRPNDLCGELPGSPTHRDEVGLGFPVHILLRPHAGAEVDFLDLSGVDLGDRQASARRLRTQQKAGVTTERERRLDALRAEETLGGPGNRRSWIMDRVASVAADRVGD